MICSIVAQCLSSTSTKAWPGRLSGRNWTLAARDADSWPPAGVVFGDASMTGKFFLLALTVSVAFGIGTMLLVWGLVILVEGVGP